jgi:Flp pilus assembly protein TadD
MVRKRQESHAGGASDVIEVIPRASGIGWRAGVIVVAVVLAYANSLRGPFVLDDNASIVQNEQIRELSRPSAVLLPERDSPVAGRPLVNLSFALNYAAGGLDVRGYHAVNVALHLVCALLAFGLIRRTLELPRVRRHVAGSSIDLAFAAALLWAVHPLNSEVVDYLTQRSESMMAALYLSTLYTANRALTAPRKRMWQSLAVVSCALGMLCKESMATAPVMVALYDRVFAFDSWRDAVRDRLRLYVGLAATWLVFVAVVLSGARSSVAGFSSGVSPWTYLLNQTVVIAHYLRLAFWPRGLVVFYGWPSPLTVGDVLPYAILILALIVATIAALRRVPALGFLGAWVFITLAPASSVVPVATEVGAERRMYLPLLALLMLTVAGIHLAWKRWSHTRAVAIVPAVALAGVAVVLMAATAVRNREYASTLSLAQTVVDRRPTGVAYHILGEQLMLEGRDAEAIAPLGEAVARGNSRAGYPLGVALLNERRLSEAVQRLDGFVRTSELPYHLVPGWLEPPRSEVVSARVMMARILASERQWSQAAAQAELALKLMPSHPEASRILAAALINAGVAQVGAGNLDAAVESFRRALAADPANTAAGNLLALALRDQQRVAAAR